MDNPGTTNSCKLWFKVFGVEFPPCLSCSMGDSTEREGEFGYYDLYLPQSSGSSMLVWGHKNTVFTKQQLSRQSGSSVPRAFPVSGKGKCKMETFLLLPKPDTATKVWHLYVCVVKCYRRKGLLYTARCFTVLNMV